MIQVDFAWQYAFGALFASLAATQLKNTDRKWWDNKFFIVSLLFSGLLFVPTGNYLLWEFPHWESMQVFSSRNDQFLISIIPLFAVATNFALCILGFYVTAWLLRKEKYFLSVMQNTVGYFVFIFILIHGWDGTGWSRFLYDPTVNNNILWTSVAESVGYSNFLVSAIWVTLLVMACFIVPFILYFAIVWQREIDEEAKFLNLRMIKFLIIGAVVVLGFPVVFGILGAIFCVLFAIIGGPVVGPYLGIFVGIPLYWVIGYFLLFRKGMSYHKLCLTIFKYKKLI